MTFDDLEPATSSLESGAGLSLLVSLDGPRRDPFGPAPAPASPTVPPASSKATPTSETCGPISSGSSASAALSASLASKLRARFATVGSIEFVQTWKEKATPSGRAYWAHTARAPRTSDRGSTGWPTPCAQQANGTPEDFLRRKRESVARGHSMGISLTDLAIVAQLATWPTPKANDAGRGGCENRANGERMNLSDYVLLAVSPRVTPRAMDGQKGATTESPCTIGRCETGKANLAEQALSVGAWATPKAEERGQKNSGDDYMALSAQVALASWATPNTVDAKGGTRLGKGQVQLCHQATLASPRVTPTARDHKSNKHRDREKGEQLDGQVQLASGPLSISSPAETGKRGALNPEHSRWLQGFPAAWGCSGGTAMQSVSQRRRRSLKPSSKRKRKAA